MPPVWRRLAALVVSGALLAGCQDDNPPPPVTPPDRVESGGEVVVPRDLDGTLRLAIQEPVAIVPAEAREPNGLLVVGALFDSLTAWGQGLDPEPGAAFAWEPSDDAATWTFHLRPSATFHDGSPVTAADVKFAWELVVRRGVMDHLLVDVEGYEALRDGDTDELTGIQAPDDATVVVNLDRPNADFPLLVGHPALAPIPRARWEDDPGAFRMRPVGNGPFAMPEDWARGQFIRTGRFDEWINGPGPAPLAEVVFQIMDPDTGYLAFQQGRIDVAAVPVGALDNAVEQFGLAADPRSGTGVLTGDLPSTYYLGFDVATPPFDHVDVRRALSLAIDRERLVAETLEGNSRVARSIVPPMLYESDACQACEHDPDTARELFEANEVTEITLWFNEGGGHEQVARLLREDLGRVGVRVLFEIVPFDALLERLEQGGVGLYRFGWQADYPSPGDMLVPLVHSGGVANFGGYADPAVDDLLAQASRMLEPGERLQLFQAAESLALDQQPIAPLLTMRQRLVVSERVRGLWLDASGRAALHEVRLSPVS